MSDIRSLLPPFGDPWPSCLLRSQSAGVSWGLVSPVTACLPSLVDTALRLREVGGSRPAARPLQRVSWALPMQPQSLWLPNALQAETPVSRQTGWVVLGHPACLPSSSWTPAPTHLPGALGGPDGDSWEQGEVRASSSLWVWSLASKPVGQLRPGRGAVRWPGALPWALGTSLSPQEPVLTKKGPG